MSLAVDHVGEQEGAAISLVEPTLELPACERMELGILVDRSLDAGEQAFGFQTGDMLLQVARRGLCFGHEYSPRCLAMDMDLTPAAPPRDGSGPQRGWPDRRRLSASDA